MTLRLNGSSSGFTQIDAPAAAGSNTITLPTSNGSANQLLKNSGTAGELKYSSMVEDSSGRVGIGETSMDGLLVIKGDSNDTSVPSIRLKDGTDTREAWISNSSGDLVLVNGGDDNVPHCKITLFDGNIMTVATANTERMRITADGALRASTNTSDSQYYSQSTQYHVLHNDTNGEYVAIFEQSHGSNAYGILINYHDYAPDGSSNQFIICSDSSATRFEVQSDGDVNNHDNSYGSISDQKLKEDIVDAGSQWDDLKNLRVRKFKLKSDVAAYGDEAKTLIGLVAQEAETVSPGLVKDNPDLDDEGNDLGTTTKSVRYSVLYMKAIKALQEAMNRIETLEAKVAALEAAE